MKTIVSYDVSTTDSGGPGRLRKVAKACKSYGVRVQYSVFECSLTDKEWLLLKQSLLDIIDTSCGCIFWAMTMRRRRSITGCASHWIRTDR